MFGSGTALITLEQFVTLMSLVINETGGGLAPISERMQSAGGHPGLAYAFDAIPNLKSSYNKATNRTAGSLFRDAQYNAAHGQRALGNLLKGTTAPVWDGQVYPQGVPPTGFPTAEDPAQTGYIMEADFYKFRGRGLLQNTWRPAYVKLVTFIQQYAGTNAKVLEYKLKWAGQPADVAATRSTNAEWDDLFQNSDLVVAHQGIAQHNAGGGNYLRLSHDPQVLWGTAPGSVYHVGKTVSGGTTYAGLLRDRVRQVLVSLPA